MEWVTSLPELVKQGVPYPSLYVQIEKELVRWMRYEIEPAAVIRCSISIEVVFYKSFLSKGSRGSVSEPSRVSVLGVQCWQDLPRSLIKLLWSQEEWENEP